MNWILASAIMYLCSVFIYIIIRKLQLVKVSVNTYLFYMFSMSTVIYLGLIIFLKIPMALSVSQLVVIIIAAVLFSFIGNVVSNHGILNAPNPGYSLIIQKSYSWYTTLAAFFLFGSDLNIMKGIGIGIIVLFTGMIVYSKKSKKTDKKWIVQSFGGFFCFGSLALTSKHLLNQGLDPAVILFYVCFIVSVLLGFRSRFKFNVKKRWHLIIPLGFLQAGFNLFMKIAYQTAPNPGYVNAINTSSIAVVTLLTALIFKDHLSLRKLVGVVGVILGIVLIVL